MSGSNFRASTLAAPDVLVVGGGVAGLAAALTAAASGAEVVLVAKAPLQTANSYRAQGGIAAAVAPGDSPNLHGADTLACGRGLSSPRAVELLAAEAPAQVAWLERCGVRFDSQLGREGGHSRRRILRVRGADTGRAVATVLAARVRYEPRITYLDGHRVTGLLDVDGRCVGAQTGAGQVVAPATILTTGGYAGLWARTTNSDESLGDGLLLAYRLGARLADLEFVQFHPTVMADGFMLSEALRGEGGLLVDANGDRFVDELAPRDVVARAVAARAPVRLDLRAVACAQYPTLVERVRRAGYEPQRDPVPIAPAAHYTIGGIATDLDGRSTIPGLYAAGECACTGVHGANRLASNSLLECLVFACRAATAALNEPSLPPTLEVQVVERTPPSARSRTERGVLGDQVGVNRTAADLQRLADSDLDLPRLVGQSCLLREETRGAHCRSDFPEADSRLDGLHSFVERDRDPWLAAWT